LNAKNIERKNLHTKIKRKEKKRTKEFAYKDKKKRKEKKCRQARE